MTILRLVTPHHKNLYEFDWSESHLIIQSFVIKKKVTGESVCIRNVDLLVIPDCYKDSCELVKRFKPPKFHFQNLLVAPGAYKSNVEILLLERHCCIDEVDLIGDKRLTYPVGQSDFVGVASEFLAESFDLGRTLVFAPTVWLEQVIIENNYIKDNLSFILGIKL